MKINNIPYEFTRREIMSNELCIDWRYQQKPDEHLVKHLLEHFDKSAVNPMIVCHRDDKYFIVDGVHIKTVLDKINKGASYPIDCYVCEINSYKDEVELFVNLRCNV